jgi:D-beta-D-heptose 7-phosphate kinase/D-beta-D-heptose 1-phosphate adenosyltransferase
VLFRSAGDTVTAYLAVMLAAHATPLEAAIVANYAAGVEVGKSGAATVTPSEVLEAYDAHAAEGPVSGGPPGRNAPAYT